MEVVAVQLLLFKQQKVLKNPTIWQKTNPLFSSKVPSGSTSPGACVNISLYCNSMVKTMQLSSCGWSDLLPECQHGPHFITVSELLLSEHSDKDLIASPNRAAKKEP